jgi:hypothetical protein
MKDTLSRLFISFVIFAGRSPFAQSILSARWLATYLYHPAIDITYFRRRKAI